MPPWAPLPSSRVCFLKGAYLWGQGGGKGCCLQGAGHWLALDMWVPLLAREGTGGGGQGECASGGACTQPLGEGPGPASGTCLTDR